MQGLVAALKGRRESDDIVLVLKLKSFLDGHVTATQAHHYRRRRGERIPVVLAVQDFDTVILLIRKRRQRRIIEAQGGREWTLVHMSGSDHVENIALGCPELLELPASQDASVVVQNGAIQLSIDHNLALRNLLLGRRLNGRLDRRRHRRHRLGSCWSGRWRRGCWRAGVGAD